MEREKKAIQEAGPGLQAELSKIGEELSALKLQRPGSNIYGTDLATRVSATEKKVGVVLEDLKSRTAAIQSDLESSIVVNEKKSKNLDKLYREANVENDLLYERFNGELEKILKRVNGTGVEEMKVQLKEAQDEAARLRKDNQRLKREVVGLRSQLKGE